MYFNSLEFLIFLPVVLILFYSVQHKFRIFILLLASYYFYISWNPIYIFLIVISTITDYTAGILLSKTANSWQRKLIVAASIFVNIGLLIYFKYTNFFIANLNDLISISNAGHQPFQLLDILLPIGISFYTFQTLSYTIDVYHKKIGTEHNLVLFATYVSFFPQLVAGPIERFSSLVPQLKTKAFLNRENISQGARLILYGFFMKMVIADNLGIFVDAAYANISGTSSLNLIVCSIFYSFQIYCDFHGYTTIAIGVAKLFNVNLSQNFNTPYLSSSLTSFWRKWHITLTSWFRDYIYYPMGGNKNGMLKWLLAIMIVFIVSGVWHGAQWTFIIWGLFHGIFTILEKLLKLDKRNKVLVINMIRTGLVFIIVTLLWVLFRSPEIKTAQLFYQSIFSNWNLEFEFPSPEMLILLALFITLDVATRKKNFGQLLNTSPIIIRWSIYAILIFLILSRSGTDMQPFIYFQF